MPSPLITYLLQRPETSSFLLTSELRRTLDEIFGQPEALIPAPYKIFPEDETQSLPLGYPVADSSVLKELETKLDRWLSLELPFQLKRDATLKEKAQAAFTAYIAQVTKVAENALLSNQLSDYHGIFWLVHSLDVSRHFCGIPRRCGQIDAQAARTQGDSLKYRIFARWAAEVRDQITQPVTRAALSQEGDEQRSLQFMRMLQDNVLIFTEEFVGPDLRELRSFVGGYLRRDPQAFRESFEKIRSAAADLMTRDKTFRTALAFLDVPPDQGMTPALLLDGRFQRFFFDNPALQNTISREDREQFQLISKRVREFAIFNQLRRGVVWMTVTPDGSVLSSDRRTVTRYARSTRPIDFGRVGVVDPVVQRFGLMYDISNFTETLGNMRRGGRKEEMNSYRQMLLFQRRLETIAQRHLLQFEKFLGDGAFYTTRRARRLFRAAAEIQRFYSDMRKKGFVFNRGLRIAINFGYYRLLPLKVNGSGTERITEFYGLGVVELSRLTTGKSNKEIEEIANLLVARGYDLQKVQQFFAPLARGVDVVDPVQQSREFSAYINANGNLINEGIVASMPLVQELSNEIAAEEQPVFRLRTPWANYCGFIPAIPGVEYIGLRLLGMVSLKGMDSLEVAEVVPFAPGEAEATTLHTGDSLLATLRQEFHDQRTPTERTPDMDITLTRDHETAERAVAGDVVICVPFSNLGEVLIGEWDPISDDVHKPLKIPFRDFERLFSLHDGVSTDTLTRQRDQVRDMYHRLAESADSDPVSLASYRDSHCDSFILGRIVERL